MIFAAVIAESGFYLIEVAGFTRGFDYTVLGYAVGSIFMCFAIFKYSLLDTLKTTSDYVVDEVSEGIIVTNRKGEIQQRTSQVVSVFSKALLKADMGFTPEFLEYVERSAPMHDLEKIAVNVSYFHHEKVNGKGYPEGLKGDEIPV